MDELGNFEKYWVDRQPWLLSLAYQLRPRYRPGWVPSWVTRPETSLGERFNREDFIRGSLGPVVDAIRLIDNKPVMLKKVKAEWIQEGYEHLISTFVSSPAQLMDRDNHCVPLYGVLENPDDERHVILVMPLLRKWTTPRFDTVGEALDMIHQAFKGLRYLHRHHIAHRDCTGFNFLMDGSEMYPDGFHPVKQDHNLRFTGPAVQKYTRTQRPPRYYWIDFGLSVSFHELDNRPRALPLHAGDKSAPEYKNIHSRNRQPTNPFPTDIYYLGNMLRMYFTEGSEDYDCERKFGFGFLQPLIDIMVQDDPSRRPDIDHCVQRLEDIIQERSSWTLRSQVWHYTDNPFGYVRRFLPHWSRRVVYIVTKTPAIPSHSRQPSMLLPLYSRTLLGLLYTITFAGCFFPQHFLGPITVFLRFVLYSSGFIILVSILGLVIFMLIYPLSS